MSYRKRQKVIRIQINKNEMNIVNNTRVITEVRPNQQKKMYEMSMQE